MCCRSGTSTRREPASCAKAASSTDGSGAFRSAIAASWRTGWHRRRRRASRAATARRAVQPVPAHGSRTVSPGRRRPPARRRAGCRPARGGSARGGRGRGGVAGGRRGRVAVRSASLISQLRLFYQLLFELGLAGVLGKGRVELLDLLGVLIGLLAPRPRHRSEARVPFMYGLTPPPPWLTVGNETLPKFAGWAKTSRMMIVSSAPPSWSVVIAAS